MGVVAGRLLEVHLRVKRSHYVRLIFALFQGYRFLSIHLLTSARFLLLRDRLNEACQFFVLGLQSDNLLLVDLLCRQHLIDLVLILNQFLRNLSQLRSLGLIKLVLNAVGFSFFLHRNVLFVHLLQLQRVLGNLLDLSLVNLVNVSYLVNLIYNFRQLLLRLFKSRNDRSFAAFRVVRVVDGFLGLFFAVILCFLISHYLLSQV